MSPRITRVKRSQFFDQVVALYVEGMHTAPEIAEIVGCSSGTVYRVLTDAGIPRRMSGKSKFTVAERQQIADEYAAGESFSALSKKWDCSIWAIRNTAKRAGVPLRGQSNPKIISPEVEAQIIALYLSGESQGRAGKPFGVGHAKVRRLLEANGLGTENMAFIPGKQRSYRGGEHHALERWAHNQRRRIRARKEQRVSHDDVCERLPARAPSCHGAASWPPA